MLHRLLFVIFASFAIAASGTEKSDPLGTGAMIPPRPGPALAGRSGTLPCADSLPATALTVTDAVDLALCNNPLTREVWAGARLQAAQLGLAKAAWLPAVDAQFSAVRRWSDGAGSNQRSADLTLSWLVYDFGTRSANIENARQLLLAAAATQDATVQSLFLAALQAYYTAQATRAAVAAASEAERASRESLAAAETRYQVGVATPADRLQARTALSQAILNRNRAEGDARTALGTLANAMGFDPQQPLRLVELAALEPDAAFEHDVEALVAEARRRRPDLRAAEAQAIAARAAIDAARAGGRPSLVLAAGPGWQEVGGFSSHGGSVGLTLNIPLFTGFDTTYRVRAAEAQAELREAQQERVRSQVALDVWRTYHSLATASQNLRATADLVASAEESERVALGRYKAGVGNILDVLNAQSALASARQQRIQANLEWNVYRAALAQAMGTLDYSLLLPSTQGKP